MLTEVGYPSWGVVYSSIISEVGYPSWGVVFFYYLMLTEVFFTLPGVCVFFYYLMLTEVGYPSWGVVYSSIISC